MSRQDCFACCHCEAAAPWQSGLPRFARNDDRRESPWGGLSAGGSWIGLKGRTKLRGFTLIEMIMVMVITGIIAAMVAVFITKPVEGYVDSARRAKMTDAADTALRRLSRDIRLALPNSLRVTSVGGTSYIEFIMTSSGGRYRDAADGSTGGNVLDFANAANLKFDVLGPPPGISANDYVVVYNLGPGFSPADAYSGGNIAQVASVSGNTVTLASNPFAAESPSLPSPNDRFQVVPGDQQAVTYACPTTGTTAGNFTRTWNYGINAAQPTPPSGGSSALLVANATCSVDYAANAEQQNGLLSIDLTLSESGESVSLFDQIHVDNSP